MSSGSFVIGIDLENYAAADISTIFSGLNTNTDDIFLQLDYGAVNRSVLDLSQYRFRISAQIVSAKPPTRLRSFLPKQ